MTVILKELYDIYGIGLKKGSVPHDFIGQIVHRKFVMVYAEAEMDMTFFSVHTSNSIKDMEEWSYKEFNLRSKVIRNALKNKSIL